MESKRMSESSVLLGRLQKAFNLTQGIANATILLHASTDGRKEAFLGDLY